MHSLLSLISNLDSHPLVVIEGNSGRVYLSAMKIPQALCRHRVANLSKQRVKSTSCQLFDMHSLLGTTVCRGFYHVIMKMKINALLYCLFVENGIVLVDL